ncbi:Mandelate racemase/muconate lactonizing enzyme [Niveomyces insectorum RCEF 264]|uniref:Mandelate racemase/muconate lactonizing enzyme n=1 Tax=Niveomyces insectorum RCEF 264 TaxID=1081102 RepID=A0A167WGH9_9HYPO|nr:Mandelate racemase/muconate lactonizing enzyme [Niveomyces insectorum RCEF 264]
MASVSKLTEADVQILGFSVTDLRFPTSLDGVGSDAMHVGTNGSHPYVQLKTNHGELTGEGIAFSNGRGSELICMALEIFAKRVVGKTMQELTRNMGRTWRYMVADSKPVWRIVCDMSPEEVVQCIDFRYITDVITPEESIEMLKSTQEGKDARMNEALGNTAVPAYTTSPGWMAFTGDRMKEVLRETIEQGYTVFKFKVGTSVEKDREKLTAVRDVLGYDNGYQIMIDANQVWSVPEAIKYMKQLVEFKPVFIEEPTNPDDVLGHAAIRKALKPYGVGVATGEAAQNRITFKQLLQAEATDVCQIDAVRLGSVNECLAVMLMALKYKIPCVPHNGAMGLTELTSHLSTIDYVAVSGRKSMLENADSHRENLRHPSKIINAHYVTPLAPGYSTGYTDEALEKYTYPNGSFWKSELGQQIMAQPTGGEL